jgi:hypothetical protein
MNGKIVGEPADRSERCESHNGQQSRELMTEESVIVA